MKKRNLFLLLLLFMGNMILYAQCSVNAGGNTTICGTSYTLQGSSSGTTGSPVWTVVSKPPGAPDPVFSNVNSLTPNVTGMTFPGNYVFQITQNCSPSGSVTSQVTITAPGDVATFTAGPDVTNIPATTGVASLNASIPNGYNASWTYYNLNSYEFNGAVVTTNATMTGTTTATPTLTLTKKADHDIDPVYRAVLRITSTINPSCWYEDSAIVRFIPNPNVSYPTSRNFCGSQSTDANSRYYYDPNSASPRFSDNTANASANPAFGTTITMNVISQPSGGNLAYGRIQNGRLYFASNFNQTPGAYVFTLTITNANGIYTTPNLTFNYNGSEPGTLSFVDAAYPEQMALYTAGNSAGAVYCNRAGTTTPITFYFKLNPLDPPTLNSTVTASGIIPAGVAPSIVVNGAGNINRSVTLTPPSGGWRVGTYQFSVIVSNGTCNRSHSYYVHISDGNRPNVEVDNMTVCYPGSGVVSATIPLPDVYKGAVNPSYFQEYGGRYELTAVSKPAGSAIPTFDPVSLRTFTNTSTVISNLNMQGEYIFKIKAIPPPGGDPGFIDKEYACSGTSYEDTFSVFVSTQVGANAGSNQNVTGTTTILNGNNPGVATGTWTVISKPTGASDPVIVDPSLYNSSVTGLTVGAYVFRWSVATGTCISTSDVTITVMPQNYCFSGDCNPNTFLNTGNPNTIEYDNMVSTFHSTMMRDATTGALMVWGERMASNGTSHVLAPTEVNSTNYPALTGDILKFTGGSSSINLAQSVVLTTTGLFAWGGEGVLISNDITSSTTFQKVSIGTFGVNGGAVKADGLPDGVAPTDVKMLFGTYNALALTTCSGEVWVLAQEGRLFGDNASDNLANRALWHRVRTNATTTLNNVVAIRGNGWKTLMALTATGEVYTWGQGTRLGNGTAESARVFATQMTLPAAGTVIPKMIGVSGSSNVRTSTYYILGTNGNVYAMGENSRGQLGDFGTTNSNTWVQVQKSVTAGDYLTNVVWISPNEHDMSTFGSSNAYMAGSINVLTADGRLWAWGANDGIMLGGSTTTMNPTEMPGSIPQTDPYNIGKLNWTDKVIAVETGGHTSMVVKENSKKYGYVGHRINGSMGDGTSVNANENQYNFADTPEIDLCGAPTVTTSVPFTCDTKFYLTQYGSAATDKTILYTLDNTTNPFTKTIIGESPAGMKVNGIGYNTVDNFLYGMRTDAANATHMVKIDANGTFTDLGAVTSLPAGGYNAGGFDNAGNYYIINFDSSNLYRINLSTNTATQITLSRSLKVNDIAFDSTTNLFYGYEQSTGRLVSINTSGVVTNVGSPSALGNVFFGAMYSDSNGDIFGNEDDGSGFYQFNKTTGQATKISESISAFGNDGANCSNAVITFPADLSITKTDGKTTYIPGSATTYTIVVSNNSGAYGVLGATVSDPVPAGIPAANVSYSVPVLTGGATTSITGPQTGALNDVVGLPIGGTITYTVTVNVPLAFTGNLTNTVTVTPPVNSTDPNTSNNTATDINTNGVCYKPGIIAGTALDTKVGITTLNRAGATDADNWPMARKGGWVALESKTKGFVPNRVAFTDADTNPATPDTPVGIAAANFREGMMVYDTTNKCLKVYTMKDGDTSMAWHCVTTQTCPD
ncbi:DUF6923 family protein [Chryseobacterium zhengzhouense]|uniref:DUF6923 family protein n=1 Tax=Chryseobacterium zhengzhouense TaxID=1636086 RepID=A0ABW2LX31_9FLAO